MEEETWTTEAVVFHWGWRVWHCVMVAWRHVV